MRILNPTASGSLNVSGSLTVTGSTNISGSVYATSFIGDGSGLTGITHYTDTDTLDYINTLGVVSSSAQLSNSTIPGNLTVGGILTAQEFHTEFVSASIVYQSGSTQFGNSLDDIHNFSGSLAVNTNNLFVSGGNVGIGTTSPVAKFEVADGFSSITLQEYNNGAAIFLDGVDGDFSGGDYYHILADGNSYLGLGGYAGGITPLNINSSGNVGIGTTSPSATLDVDGNVTATAGTFNLNTTDGGFKIVGINATPTTLAYLANNYFPKIYTRNHNFGITFFDQDNNDVGIQAADLVNGSNAKALVFNPYGGNVGIGTTNPSGKLHIQGDGNAQQLLRLQHNGTGGNGFFDLNIQNNIANLIANYSTTPISMGFYTAATERMRLTPSGSLLIGTTTQGLNPQSQGYLLGVKSNVSQALISIAKSGQTLDTQGMIVGLDATTGYVWMRESISLTLATADSPRLTITSGGNVGIGTTSPSAKLEILSDGSAANGAEIRLQHANNNSTDVVSTVNFANNGGSVAMIQGGTTGANNNGYISFFTDNAGTSSEKMRIDSSGNVGIGTTSPAEKLHVVGNIVSTGDVTAYYSSDERLKENKEVIQNPLDKLNKISGYTFDWKKTPSFGVPKNDVGVIAQEIEEILPQIVTDREDGYKAVRYEKIIPLLIESIKELSNNRKQDQERIDYLEKIIKDNGITE